MELAYLGLFSKIFNWVMSKIFDPVFKFISDLLSTVLSWVFNEILAPILFPILEEVLEFAIDLYKTIYSFQMYSLFAGVLKLIDYLEIAFDVFIGRRDVTYITDKGVTISGTLLEVLVQHEMVSTVFWVLTLSGFGIAMLLTIFGTAKSAFDLDFENKRPVSRVLTAMMKCFIQFFMVPFFVYFMLILATDILKIATDAISGDTPTTLGRIVFMIASLNASRTESLNADYLNKHGNKNGIILGTSPEDSVRFPFYTTESYTWKGKTIAPIEYINVKAVNNDFNLADFDYLIGFLAAIFLLFIMAVCIITFVQRIFEIILLYIVSPYFVSTMPLDDGERFGRWRDLFIGKCFTGFGSAIGMRLYLVVCQMIMGGSIRFTDAKIVSSIEIDYFMKLFFLLGGAWAVFKSGPMITQLLSASAGQQESATQAVAGGAIYGHTISKAMNAGKGALMSLARKGGAALGAKGQKGKNADPNQKFAGSKNDSQWKKGAVSPNAQRSKLAIGAHRKPKPQWKAGAKPEGERGNKLAIGANRKPKPQWKAGVKPEGERGSKIKIGAHRAGGAAKLTAKPAGLRQRRASMSDLPSMKAAATAVRARRASFLEGQKITTPLKPLELKTAKAAPKIQPGRLAMSKDPKMMAAAKAATAAVGTSKVIPEKEKKNFRFGRMLQSTYDANGNHKIRVMGFGVDRDAQGKTMAFQMPIAGLKVQRTDPNQSMKLARMHIPGITRISSNVQNGQLKYSDISILHGAVRYHSDEEGSKYRVLGGMAKASKDESGTHVRVLGGLTNVHHGQGNTDVKVMGGLTKVHHGQDGTHVRVMGGLTDVKVNETGTHVGVMGVHGHGYAEGGGGFDMLGGHVSVRANSEHLQSMKIGLLEYSRSGIITKVSQSTGVGSATTSASVETAPRTSPVTAAPKAAPAPEVTRTAAPTAGPKVTRTTISTSRPSASEATQTAAPTVGPKVTRTTISTSRPSASEATQTAAPTAGPKVTRTTISTSRPSASEATQKATPTVGPKVTSTQSSSPTKPKKPGSETEPGGK